MPHRPARRSGSDDRIIDWVNDNTESAQEAVHAIGIQRKSGEPSDRQVQALIETKYGEKKILAALGRGSEVAREERDKAGLDVIGGKPPRGVVLEPGERFERLTIKIRRLNPETNRFHHEPVQQERVRYTGETIRDSEGKIVKRKGTFVKIRRPQQT